MKQQVIKKIWSLALALVLALGTLCLPAAAAEHQAGDTPCPKCGSRNITERIDQPTCTASGGCRWVCLDCGLEMTMVGTSYWNSLNKEALGHDYMEGVCTRCGAKDPGYQPPAEVPSAGAGTETAGGGTSGGTGDPGSGTGDASSSGSETGGAGSGTGGAQTCTYHTWERKYTASTCTTQGRAYQVCRVCGLEETTRSYPLAEHKYQLTETIPATAAAEGRKTYTCSVCGDSYEETTPKLAASGTGGTSTACVDHRWSYASQSATCTQEGKYTRTCTVCGLSEVYYTVPASGHRYTSQITKAATVEQEGVKTYTCTACGDTYTEAVPKIPAAEAATKTGLRDSGSTSLKKLSQAEIAQLLQNAPHTTESDPFSVKPSLTAPYTPGAVKASVLQETLDRLNAMRRIAGLPSVQLDSGLCENAQYGAVLLVATGKLDHRPAQPADMDSSFYKQGYGATSSSNLASWYTITGAVDAFMDDSDSSNIDRLGHRRWQLNPLLGKVGFGRAGGFTVEKVFDQSGSGCDYDFISWPASGNFPAELFDGGTAWSVTLDPQQYDTSGLSGVTVTLTRESDGKSWTLRSGGSDGYFNVNLGNYGVSNCIIFRPDGVSAYDGTYTVRISGLKAKNGQAVSDFAYQVDFFGGTSTGTSAQPVNTATQQSANSSPFTDVAEGTYYHDAVLWALENNITTGVTATQFQPNAACTRGQVVTFLWRAKGCPEPVTKVNPFTDVSASSPFYKAILWAYENNITTGTTATTFNPGGTCTSAHVVTFLWRANGKPAASGTSALAGTYPGGYYTNAVAWADSSGLLSGTGKTFMPGAMSPRADIVTYLYRDLAA